jgi:tRNA (cytosine38-C5)-methyltransferase
MRYYLLAKLKPLSFAEPPKNTIIGYIPHSSISKEFVDTRLIKDEEELVNESAKPIDPVSKYLEHLDHYDTYLVPDKVLAKHSQVFDVVKPSSHRSCCFTKGYFHYAQGTGSVLQMNEEANVRCVK